MATTLLMVELVVPCLRVLESESGSAIKAKKQTAETIAKRLVTFTETINRRRELKPPKKKTPRRSRKGIPNLALRGRKRPNFSVEWRQNIGSSKKGQQSWNKGKRFSEQTKRKMAAAQVKRYKTTWSPKRFVKQICIWLKLYGYKQCAICHLWLDCTSFTSQTAIHCNRCKESKMPRDPNISRKIGDKLRGRKRPTSVGKSISQGWARRRAAGLIKRKSDSQKTQPGNIARNKARAKEYIVVSPDGRRVKIRNLAEFCLAHGLNRSHMIEVAKGSANHHRGWHCYYPIKTAQS